VFVFEGSKAEIELRIVTSDLTKHLQEYKTIVQKLSSTLKMKVIVSAGDWIRRANAIHLLGINFKYRPLIIQGLLF